MPKEKTKRAVKVKSLLRHSERRVRKISWDTMKGILARLVGFRGVLVLSWMRLLLLRNVRFRTLVIEIENKSYSKAGNWLI